MEPKLPSFDQHGKTESNGREHIRRVIKTPLAPSDRRIAPVVSECSPTVKRKGVRAARQLLTVRQVAQNWQVSERTIRRMIADRRIEVVRLGRSVRIPV